MTLLLLILAWLLLKNRRAALRNFRLSFFAPLMNYIHHQNLIHKEAVR